MTSIFYYSNRSKPCVKILQVLETMPHIRSKFQYVNIVTNKPAHNITHVPAIIMENQKLEGKQVFDWLESEKNNNTLPPFEIGFGTNNFSSISSEGQAENNQRFTYIEDAPVEQASEQKEIKGNRENKIGDSVLDDLINQRKLDIPIQRQRS